MARRVIKIDGDPSGLQKAASAATTALKTELENQKKLVADAKAAQKALGDSATKEERAAAKAQVAAANEVLRAKQDNYKAAQAAAKAAADTEKRLAKETADVVMREARRAADAKRQAAADSAAQDRKLYGIGPKGGGDGAGGSANVGEQIKRFAAGMLAAVATFDRVFKALEAMEKTFLEKSLSAEDVAAKRAESLRLAGVNPIEAQGLAKRIGLINPTISSGDITSALDLAASEGSGNLSGKTIEEILKGSSGATAGSALVAASSGLSVKNSLALAERYRMQSRGGSLDRDQAEAAVALLKGGAITGAGGVADYLAAAKLSGVDVASVVRGDNAAADRNDAKFTELNRSREMARNNVEKLEAMKYLDPATKNTLAREKERMAAADMAIKALDGDRRKATASQPFLNQDQRLIDEYIRMRNRAGSTAIRPGILTVEGNINRNETEAGLVAGDQIEAQRIQRAQQTRERAGLVVIGQGAGRQRAAAVAVDAFNVGSVAQSFGVLPGQNGELPKIKVEVTNPPRIPADP